MQRNDQHGYFIGTKRLDGGQGRRPIILLPVSRNIFFEPFHRQSQLDRANRGFYVPIRMIRVGWTLHAHKAPQPAHIFEPFGTAGLTGVEIVFGDLDSLASLAGTVGDLNMPLVSIASTLAVPVPLRADSAWLDPPRRWIMTAAEIGCPQVRLSLQSSAYRPSLTRLAEQLQSMAGLAAELSVRVVIDRIGPVEQPRDLWTLLELSGGNLFAGLVIRPGNLDVHERRKMSLAIPLLNRRIRHVVIGGCNSEGLLSSQTAMAVHHLMGIGYEDWIMVDASPDNVGAIAASVRHWAGREAPAK